MQLTSWRFLQADVWPSNRSSWICPELPTLTRLCTHPWYSREDRSPRIPFTSAVPKALKSGVEEWRQNVPTGAEGAACVDGED